MKNKKLYAIIGKPVTHSLSPVLHNHWFNKYNIEASYSLIDIDSHLYKIVSYPLYLTLITILSAIIMFNIGYQKNSFFKITFGILLSVTVYYVNYFFNVLGTNEKIPLILSIFMPLIILSIINFISIIKINEK